MAHIVLGVAGGIAAYKAVELLRELTESGHDVRVVPTAAALQFVGAPTWAALSGKPAVSDVWSGAHRVDHVYIGEHAELVIVAPATADLMARAAAGIADDLLTNVLLVARCPVVMAPAMHTQMWQHPATVANVAVLRSRGIDVMEPETGRLTGTDSGLGRLPEPAAIAARALAHLRDQAAGSMTGVRVVVSAGGTRESVDPVRFLGNRSSGKQGVAIAHAAAARGADVALVAANVEPSVGPSVGLSVGPGIEIKAVESAAQLHEAVMSAAKDADVVVMAAAVADYRPVAAPSKVKKTDQPLTVTLHPTVDVLSDLVSNRASGQVIVGFAAETGDDDVDWREYGRQKLRRKGCDVLVVNQVGEDLAFGSETNTVVIMRLDPAGEILETEIGPASKRDIAEALWDALENGGFLAAVGSPNPSSLNDDRTGH